MLPVKLPKIDQLSSTGNPLDEMIGMEKHCYRWQKMY